MKNNNDIFSWGKVDRKTLWHLLGSIAGFILTYWVIDLLNLKEALQMPYFASGVAVLFVAFIIEYYQMKVSLAKIDVLDLLTAVAGCVIGWGILKWIG